MMPRLVAASTAKMEGPASLAKRVPSACARHHSLDLNASIPPTAPVIPTHAIMVAHVNTPLRLRSTAVSAQPTSMASNVTSWIGTTREGQAMQSRHRRRWRKLVRSRSARSVRTTSSAMCSATTMRAAGTTVTAHSTSTIHGRIAQPHCSVGATSTTENAIHSVTTLDAFTMGSTARTWKDSASE